MIPVSSASQKKEAFRLFEDGRYQESLHLCRAILSGEKDQAVEVLCATNLFSLGDYDEAEAAFRDLAVRLPESSHVHSYLARILEARGEEAAVAEYATAVQLDPENLEALKSYAAYLVSHRDFRGALPVLRRLVQTGKQSGDLQLLIRALVDAGEAEEAVAAAALFGEHCGNSPAYIDALLAAGYAAAAAAAARDVWQTTGDPAAFSQLLDALRQTDRSAALETCLAGLGDNPDPTVLLSCIRLLREQGRNGDALDAVRSDPVFSAAPLGRLILCELLGDQGRDAEARAGFEDLIREEAIKSDEPDLYRTILAGYRELLLRHADPGDGRRQFLRTVSGCVDAVSLTEAARLCEDTGDPAEARSLYYRAYRADFLTGGLPYAGFLSRQGEARECEKVMLYILQNVKKGQDLLRVARAVLDQDDGLFRLGRLMDQLIHRLELRQASLDSDGRELLAMSYFLAASDALDKMDYAACKQRCLAGMDLVPLPPGDIRLEDFLEILRAAKARTVADRPVLSQKQRRRAGPQVAAAPAPEQLPDLTDQEQKVFAFLKKHRRASELDLRKVLGTRRAVGILNQLIRKLNTAGIACIGKRGMGEEGEMYEYTGT